MIELLFKKVKNFKEGMLHVFIKHSKEIVRLIEENKENCDVSDLFYRFTLDSIGVIAFGHDIGSLKDPNIEFAKAWDICNTYVTRRLGSFNFNLRKKFHPEEKIIRESIKVMDEFTDKILKARREEDDALRSKRFDLLSLFLSRKDEYYSDKYLKDMILNMVIAGRDTTAQSLAWTCYLLALSPQVRKKATQEVDTFLSDSETLDYDTLKKMEYLHAIVSESLRLYPSVPSDAKSCINDDVLPSGHPVEAGTLVFYFTYAMGRSTAIWGEDAKVFRPERFIENPQLSKNQWKYPVFQGGPRTCLGQNMAFIEEVTLLAFILQKYDFKLAPNQNVEMLDSLTAPMKQNLRLTFSKRLIDLD